VVSQIRPIRFFRCLVAPVATVMSEFKTHEVNSLTRVRVTKSPNACNFTQPDSDIDGQADIAFRVSRCLFSGQRSGFSNRWSARLTS